MKLQQSKFHFVGVGGIGMCGLAEILFNMGAQVTGSDLAENANMEHLRKIGIPVVRGHSAHNVGDVDVVVYSSAVPEKNPEIEIARARRIPLIPRAEALAEIMRLKRGIAVAGTHGKTTTTSMVAAIFLEAKSNPTIFVGGRLNLIKSTALLGSGEWLIAEADESDGSFQKLSPEISIITNIDSDHLDYYKSFENLQNAFMSFSLKIPFYGALIICGDDQQTRTLFSHFPKQIMTYGFHENNDYWIKGENGIYDVFENRRRLGQMKLAVPGRHNALNGLAATVCGLRAGLDFDLIIRGLAQYHGVERRFQLKGQASDILVYDDYGHHPTEVRATLQAFKEKYPDQRLVVLFQPHRFSRTQLCWFDFTTSFSLCEKIILTDIYPAGEKPIEGVHSEKLANDTKHPNCQYLKNNSELASSIAQQLQANDVFLTLGAGDGWKIGMSILELLQKRTKVK